ncbi:hypothetical protein GGS26DRAFT_169356 [Hypomontagnella submonticulosa]|nr:hypothetical protein GGS26DRAFT_169356 [Hypomontagnella submonticulosa]
MSCQHRHQDKGTPVRDCELAPNELPNLDVLRGILEQMCIFAFDWSYPSAYPPEPIKANTHLRNVDQFLYLFEKSRQENAFDQFKETMLRPNIAANTDMYILRIFAELAQMRALLICYLLATRIAPVLHQDMIDRMDVPDTPYERRQIPTDRQRYASKVVGAFWGSKHSGNPLPFHVTQYMGISDYDGWADRVDDKLVAMARKINESPQRMKDLF